MKSPVFYAKWILLLVTATILIVMGYYIGVARAERVYTDELNELNATIQTIRQYYNDHGAYPRRREYESGLTTWVDAIGWAAFHSGVRRYNHRLEIVFGEDGNVEFGRFYRGRTSPLLRALEEKTERNRWIRIDTSPSRYERIYEEIAGLTKNEFLAAMPKEVPDSCANPRVFSGTSKYVPIHLFLQMRFTVDTEEAITLRDSYLPLAVHYQRGAELPEVVHAHAFRNAANDGFGDLAESFEVMVLKYGSNGEEFDHEWTGSSTGIAIDVEQGEVIYWAMYVTSP